MSLLSLPVCPFQYMSCYSTVVGKMTTFDLWPLPLGGGAWGAETNMWHPKTLASYESLSAPLSAQIITLWKHISGGRGRGGALILDRCRAFDLFASVDAHLCYSIYQYFSCFLLDYSAYYMYFDPFILISSQKKLYLHSRHLTSCLVYETESTVLVKQGDRNIRNQSTHWLGLNCRGINFERGQSLYVGFSLKLTC